MTDIIRLPATRDDTLWAVVASLGKTDRIADIYPNRTAALADRNWREQQVNAYAGFIKTSKQPVPRYSVAPIRRTDLPKAWRPLRRLGSCGGSSSDPFAGALPRDPGGGFAPCTPTKGEPLEPANLVWKGACRILPCQPLPNQIHAGPGGHPLVGCRGNAPPGVRGQRPPALAPDARPHDIPRREVGGGRAPCQPGQVRKEAAAVGQRTGRLLASHLNVNFCRRCGRGARR